MIIYSEAIAMANTFTPNNDGINDTWKISGLESDPTALVSIYNRYGSLVFQSRGYTVPWDGCYRGRPLPVGAYFYVIFAKNNSQIIKGCVTIIY
jgi:gliding motility-associated-like protein